MRFQVFVFLLLGLGYAPGIASTGAVHLYNEANALYKKGQYEGAVARYEDTLAQGIRHADVYYNLGNAYYKAGQIGRAILAYERALKLTPNDEDIKANLGFVNALKVDKEEVAEVNVVTRFGVGIYRMFSADGVAILCSVCVLLLSLVGICWVFAPQRRGVWIGALILVGVVGLASAGILAFKVQDRMVEEAIVLAEEVVGRSGPGEDFLQVFSLHEGTKVVIERKEARWLLVRLGSGIGGWVPDRALERI